MSQKPRKRGRPPTIDSDAAMQTVVELFRAKGFSAVSLDDLSDATGLSRPSLYRSFGDKLSMYIGSLDAFEAQVARTAIPALLEDCDLQTALRNFYDEMLAIYYRDDGVAAGCLIYGTAPSSADMPDVKSHLQSSIERLDAAMRRRIKEAFPKVGAERLELAVSIASNTLIAFSARAKSGALQAELSLMGAQSADAIDAVLNARR
ncbi:MAG: TetR/AcrR family transcriptional regulator [Pseudomonadota bacterium]